MSSIPVIKFMFANQWKVLEDSLSSAPAYESESYGAAADLATALGMAQAGMIVASLKDKNDLIQLATLIKMVKKLSPATFVKVIVVNFSGEKQFEKAAAKLGILDIVEARIQTKALRFKIDFMMKSVNVHLKKMTNVQANSTIKAAEISKAQEKKSFDTAPIWKDSLENENDIWLMKSESDCKKILTRWLIKMMGPSPYIAQWVESNNPGIWRFDFKSEMETFISGKGSWFYKGDQKPDFVWAENVWSFTGSSFDLFYKEGAETISRMTLKDKQLTVAKNSEYAKTKEQNIIESFDKDLLFQKEKNGKIESDTVDKDTESYQNLEGKGKTDTLKHNPLSGKSKTSHLKTDPLSMDLNPKDSNLSSDPLSHKGSTAEQSGPLKGKDTPDSPAAGNFRQPTTNAGRSEDNLEMDNNNKYENYYKGHNEAEKYEAKDIGHVIKKDGIAENLKGKTSTDEIPGHLKSPELKGSPSAAKPPKMSGNSFTELMQDHLKSPDSKVRPEVATTDETLDERKSSEERKKSAEMSGKSQTDKLPSHMSGRQNQASGDVNKNPNERKKDSNFISNDDFNNDGSVEAQSNKRTESVLGSKQNKVISLEDAKSEKQERANQAASGRVTNELKPLQEPSQELKDSTQTAVVTSMLSQDLVRIDCKLDDHFDNTIIFTASKCEFSLNKPVSLNLNFNYMGKDSSLKFKAKLTSVDLDDEGLQYITVEISEEAVSSFNSFMKLFGSRQQNINYFMKAAKGY